MSNRKDYMIKTLHKLYGRDNWINELYNSIGLQLMPVDTQNENNYNNLFFSNLNEAGCKLFEKDLGIKARSSDSLEQRRNRIQSKWLASYWCTLPVLQNIADTYFNGLVEIRYNGDAKLVYTGRLGFDEWSTDVTEFHNTINEVKPAHFGYEWTYIHNTWDRYYHPRTWDTANEHSWNELTDTLWGYWSDSEYCKKWSYSLNRTWGEMMNKEVEY